MGGTNATNACDGHEGAATLAHGRQHHDVTAQDLMREPGSWSESMKPFLFVQHSVWRAEECAVTNEIKLYPSQTLVDDWYGEESRDDALRTWSHDVMYHVFLNATICPPMSPIAIEAQRRTGSLYSFVKDFGHAHLRQVGVNGLFNPNKKLDS
jgi:hypothetical protein